MNRSIRKWLSGLNIPLDEDGLPIPICEPITPTSCFRCGSIAEMPPVGHGVLNDQYYDRMIICSDCWRLQFIDPVAFMNTKWDKQ